MIATDTQLVLASSKLGDVPYSAEDVIRFPHGLPGFEALHDFLLVTREECEPFLFLASIERTDVTLPLIPLALASPSTTPPASAVAELGEAGENALGCYAVVSIGVNATTLIVNLRAPVIVNLDTRLGRQLILADESLSLTAPLGM